LLSWFFKYLSVERQGLPQSHTRAKPVSTPQMMPVMHCTRLRTSWGASEGLLAALDVLRCHWYANYGRQKHLLDGNEALLVVWSSLLCYRSDCYVLEPVVVYPTSSITSSQVVYRRNAHSPACSLFSMHWLLKPVQ
jgi:hypothetical protein